MYTSIRILTPPQALTNTYKMLSNLNRQLQLLHIEVRSIQLTIMIEFMMTI